MTDILVWLSAIIAKPDVASWLQAFAAIVALIISVWAARQAGAAERRRDRSQARGIAVAIYPELQKLGVTVADIQSTLTKFRADAGNLVGQSVAVQVQSLAQISMPPMIDRNIDRLFMLGEPAGPTCLELVGIIFQFNALVEQLVARMMTMSPVQWTEAVGHLSEHLTLIGRVIEKCEKVVQRTHDSIRG